MKPQKFESEKKKYHQSMLYTASIFILPFFPIMILFDWRYHPTFHSIIPAVCGVILFLLGLSFLRIKTNPVLGIKNTWTLSNETRWRKTHDLAAITWMMGGFYWILTLFVIYSYLYVVLLLLGLIYMLIPYLTSFLKGQKQDARRL